MRRAEVEEILGREHPRLTVLPDTFADGMSQIHGFKDAPNVLKKQPCFFNKKIRSLEQKTLGHRTLDRTFTIEQRGKQCTVCRAAAWQDMNGYLALVHGNRCVHDDVNTAYIVNIGKCNFGRSRLENSYCAV